MKKGMKLLVMLLIVGGSFAQNDSIRERECLRMRFLAGKQLEVSNYAGAVSYYLKGEEICGNYDKDIYDRIATATKNTIITTKDKSLKLLYADTLLDIFSRMESKGFFDNKDLLDRAKYSLKCSKVDILKADTYFVMAQENKLPFGDYDLALYYQNIYNIYRNLKSPENNKFRERLISEYFLYVNTISSEKYKEGFKSIFNNVVKTCADFLPDLKNYMTKLPSQKEDKIKMINMFMDMMSELQCTDSPEYEMLVDSIIQIDNSVDAVIAKKKLLFAKNRYNETIEQLKIAKEMTDSDSLKQEFVYEILKITYYNKKSLKASYNLALGISGKYRSKALEIAADVVANMANSCGISTFDRKCNYIYAAELAEKAGLSSKAQKYRSYAPTNQEKFDEGNPTTAVLSCWGVTVNL